MADDRVAVLLDTDIGSDIDDAVALAYLLAHPACDLVGITTVSGNTAERAACVEALCAAASRVDVPVHQGLEGPLLHGPGQPHVPQYAAVTATHPSRPPRRDAVEFMREAIRSRPGEIELLSVGPLTNVAVLFALDPEIPGLLRGFTSMAGAYLRPDREWNVLVDPTAAAIAFRHAPAGHRCVGLDVTQQVRLDRDEVAERFARSPTLRVVLDMAQVWFREHDVITFHDPLAAAVVLEPSLCTFETGTVTVDSDGATPFEPRSGGPHRVAVTVDAERFFAEYFGRTLA